MAAFIPEARWEGGQPTINEEKETDGLRTNFWRLHVNWLQGDTVTEQVRPRPAPVLSHNAFPGSTQGPPADDQGQGRDGADALPSQGAQSSRPVPGRTAQEKLRAGPPQAQGPPLAPGAAPASRQPGCRTQRRLASPRSRPSPTGRAALIRPPRRQDPTLTKVTAE